MRLQCGQRAPDPMIADPKLDLYSSFQLETSRFGLLHWKTLLMLRKALREKVPYGSSSKGEGDPHQLPGDFLIDPEGLIWKAFYGRSYSDHISFQDVYSFADDPCLALSEATL